MSLVVAAYNKTDIVIGSESLSTYRKDGMPFVPDEEVQKVVPINQKLALMITGAYFSDKLQFIRDYQHDTSNILDLDRAYRELFNMAETSMVLHKGEGFMIGLAGYHAGKPGFKLIIREYGQGISYVEDYPFNYYLSGEDKPVQFAEELIKKNDIPSQPSTDKIEAKIREIVGECIERYPQKLGEPVNILILTNS